MQVLVGLFAALALAASPAAAQSVADLIGGPAEAVADRFAGASWTAVEFAAVGETRYSAVRAGRGCAFEGSDGRIAPSLWLFERQGVTTLVAPGAPVRVEDGRVRPPAILALADAPGAQPLETGLAGVEARLAALAWSQEIVIRYRCASPSAARRGDDLPAAAAPLALIAYAPVILFGVPAENRSLARAAEAGPAIAALLQPGAILPGGAAAFARRHDRFVRLHGDADGYAVLSVDLGGSRGSGIGLPREAVFAGVRDGVVEWRAMQGLGVETALCVDADGDFGGRKGCSATGHYNPRP